MQRDSLRIRCWQSIHWYVFIHMHLKRRACLSSWQLRAIYTVLIELHKFGVVHRDAADRNMFLLRPIDPLNPRLVIFDFNVARTLDMSRSSQEKVKTSWLDMDKNRMAWFCEHMGEVVMNCKWAETDEGQSILQQWRKHPSKLTEEERRPAWVRQTEQSKL